MCRQGQPYWNDTLKAQRGCKASQRKTSSTTLNVQRQQLNRQATSPGAKKDIKQSSYKRKKTLKNTHKKIKKPNKQTNKKNKKMSTYTTKIKHDKTKK